MKKLTLFALASAVLFGLVLTNVSYAQVDPDGNPHNRGQIKVNFVDEDGDGICDNGTGTGIGTGGGKMGQGGQGQGQGGQGTGTGTRLRLRDESCLEEGTVAVGAPASGANTNRMGRSRSAAPSK